MGMNLSNFSGNQFHSHGSDSPNLEVKAPRQGQGVLWRGVFLGGLNG